MGSPVLSVKCEYWLSSDYGVLNS